MNIAYQSGMKEKAGIKWFTGMLLMMNGYDNVVVFRDYSIGARKSFRDVPLIGEKVFFGYVMGMNFEVLGRYLMKPGDKLLSKTEYKEAVEEKKTYYGHILKKVESEAGRRVAKMNPVDTRSQMLEWDKAYRRARQYAQFEYQDIKVARSYGA